MMEKRKITVAAIGAGNRMSTYAAYTDHCPGEMELVAVVEPNEIRRENLAQKYQVPENRRFADWKVFLQQEKIADAVFICTPDHLHYEPAMLALARGYHILLEKPIAQSREECEDIVRFAREQGRIAGVCHVLRYNPYYMKLRELVAGGFLGELISINHIEAVGIERMTHAFVRGLWRKESEANPMILSKACHDLDLLVWLTGRKCRQVSSYGTLKWFKAGNAPAGSALRCIDGCRVEHDCPYSAVDLYLRRKRWLRHFDIPENGDPEPVILHELRTGPYGRCVYHCDNDVVDHQVVAMLMEDDVTINFSMDAFTKTSGRKTHLMFSKGEAFGDEHRLTLRSFHQDVPDEVIDFADNAGECNFHGGADLNIVKDFLDAVRLGKRENLLTNIESSLESHRIAFEIERKRLESVE